MAPAYILRSNVHTSHKIKDIAIGEFRDLPITDNSEKDVIQQGKQTELHNITDHVVSMMGKDLHLRKGHPINTIKTLIEDYFHNQWTLTSGISKVSLLQLQV